jgi:hypothetical protein
MTHTIVLSTLFTSVAMFCTSWQETEDERLGVSSVGDAEAHTCVGRWTLSFSFVSGCSSLPASFCPVMRLSGRHAIYIYIYDDDDETKTCIWS